MKTTDIINPNTNHKEIPGNPSTATSSSIKLSDRSNGKPLRVLSEEDWDFWIHNGYVVIKKAVSTKQAVKTADFLWEFEEKVADDPATWYTQERAEADMKELTGGFEQTGKFASKGAKNLGIDLSN